MPSKNAPRLNKYREVTLVPSEIEDRITILWNQQTRLSGTLVYMFCRTPMYCIHLRVLVVKTYSTR